MVTFSFNGQGFEQIQFQMQMMHFQQLANQIIQSYDFNDIQQGIKYSKEITTKKETLNNQEKLEIISDLFNNLIGWLEKNGRAFE